MFSSKGRKVAWQGREEARAAKLCIWLYFIQTEGASGGRCGRAEMDGLVARKGLQMAGWKGEGTGWGGGERRLEAKGLRGLMPLRVGKWKRPFASDLPVRSGKRFETEFTVILFKYMGHLSLFVEIFFLEKIMNFHIL